MRTRRIREVVVMMLMLGLSLPAQDVRFEQVDKALFAAGGTFVNAWADYDGDADLDLFVGFDGTPNRLYRNEKSAFADVAVDAGIADARATRAAAWGDADADGDPDLLVGFTPIAAGAATAVVGSPSVLRFYRNTKGRFRDETEAVGLRVDGGAVRQPVWVDFDEDNDLDLFVAFRDKANALFRNDGARFVDIAGEAGLADTRRTVGAAWFDYDRDGDLDVITGNMDGDANGLFRQENGKFTDVAETAGVAWGNRTPKDAANGTVRPCVADVNGDGSFDVFFANYGKNGLFLYDERKRAFENVSSAWAIDIDARYDSCAFADMDNDGDLDFYVNGTVTGGKNYPDYLFRNTGTTFEDVTPAEVGSPLGDHGVQWTDFDLDGDVDLALTGVQKDGMHWLLRNTVASTPVRGLNVRVADRNGRSMPPGTEVTLWFGRDGSFSRHQTRLVDAGSGYNSQNDAPLHVALPTGTPTTTMNVSVRRGRVLTSTVIEKMDVSRWQNRVYEVRFPGVDLRQVRPGPEPGAWGLGPDSIRP